MIRLGFVLWLNVLAVVPAAPQRSVALQRIDISALPEIVLYLTVTDAKENSVLGLTDREVSVLLDGRPQKVHSLKSAIQGGEFLAVALLFDRSGSLRNSLDETKAAAIEFGRRLSTDDQLAVVSFDDQVRIDTPFSSDRGAIENAVRNIATGRDTALFDAVRAALGLFEGVPTKRQAILILSDGKDTKSRSRRDDTLAEVKAKGIPIFALGLGESLNQDLLSALAGETGGQFVKAARADELMRIYQKIADRLKNQYRLSFALASGQDGLWHKLAVRVKDGLETTDSPSREFIASLGPGVSRELVSGFERQVAERNYLVFGGAGAGLGLLLGCLLIVLVKALRPDVSLRAALVLLIILLTVLLGSIVGLVVQAIGAG